AITTTILGTLEELDKTITITILSTLKELENNNHSSTQYVENWPNR
ncbi:3470_t:CDS:1, partial [Cetraspora pellucida]